MKEIVSVYYDADGHPNCYDYRNVKENEVDETCQKMYNELITEYPEGEIINFDIYSRYLDEYYEKKPICEITKKEWWEQLECLPPLNWRAFNGVEEFFVPEFTESCFTGNYIKYKDRYFCKTVSYYDKSQWLSNNIYKLDELMEEK